MKGNKNKTRLESLSCVRKSVSNLKQAKPKISIITSTSQTEEKQEHLSVGPRRSERRRLVRRVMRGLYVLRPPLLDEVVLALGLPDLHQVPLPPPPPHDDVHSRLVRLLPRRGLSPWPQRHPGPPIGVPYLLFVSGNGSNGEV